MVEQHFGSELVDIEVEIGFMETRPNKQNEREIEHLLSVLHFLSNWWRSKLKEK